MADREIIKAMEKCRSSATSHVGAGKHGVVCEAGGDIYYQHTNGAYLSLSGFYNECKLQHNADIKSHIQPVTDIRYCAMDKAASILDAIRGDGEIAYATPISLPAGQKTRLKAR